ncbi:MAG: hypothetical protein AB7N76_10540 [Planctomycetota bacterium]
MSSAPRAADPRARARAALAGLEGEGLALALAEPELEDALRRFEKHLD